MLELLAASVGLTCVKAGRPGQWGWEAAAWGQHEESLKAQGIQLSGTDVHWEPQATVPHGAQQACLLGRGSGRAWSQTPRGPRPWTPARQQRLFGVMRGSSSGGPGKERPSAQEAGVGATTEHSRRS